MEPLLVIVGETASGKSALALELARRFNGEIICADSRTIYKGMDIGTAKPTKAEQTKVKHHLLDIITPDRRFTAAEFKQQALEAIADIHARGKLPIMVGGTGLYIDAVLYDYEFSEVDAERDDQNPRHLKQEEAPDRRKPLRPNTLVIGLENDKQELAQKITERTEQMIKNGLEQEVKGLVKVYGWAAPGMLAIGYREWQQSVAIQEITEQITRSTVRYAKRQRTWFKRNKSIHWITNKSDAVDITTAYLNNI